MKKLILLACLSFLLVPLRAAQPYPDRFVWVFGWGLSKDSDVEEISRVLDTAGQHGLNGAVVSFGLDSLCKQSADYFHRLDAVKQACERNHLDLIPAVFSVGYGGGILAHDRNLAEGLADNRELAPREFNLSSTTDWRKLSMLVNSLHYDKILLYAGLWGGKAGKVWLDDWSVEEVGPINVLRRPGTPVTVRNEDGTTIYLEGRDYAPLQDPHLSPWRDDGEAVPLKLVAGSRIHDGERLRVSWYHSMLINDSQVTVCMAEPALYDIFDHEAKLLAEQLHPHRVVLGMDEVRMGGTCRACRGRNMGELLGECVTKQAASIRRYSPGAQIYVWSDMFDPNHNAHGNYYLVDGDFTGSWQHVPKDLVMAVWGGAPREKSLKFFAEQGFSTLVACYYDADDLGDVKGWLQLARQTPKVRGFMYTPWQRKYSLLPAFGDLLAQ